MAMWNGKADMNARQQSGPIYTINGHTPNLGEDVFVAPTAAVIGNVTIGKGSSVWFSAVVRGDDMPIVIGENTNVQDGAILHSTEGVMATTIGNGVVIGHGAMLHGCVVEDDALIGIGSIILNGARIGEGAIIAAGALVPPNKIVPNGTLWLGNPGHVKRDSNEGEQAFVAYAAQHYKAQAQTYLNNGIGFL